MSRLIFPSIEIRDDNNIVGYVTVARDGGKVVGVSLQMYTKTSDVLSLETARALHRALGLAIASFEGEAGGPST